MVVILSAIYKLLLLISSFMAIRQQRSRMCYLATMGRAAALLLAQRGLNLWLSPKPHSSMQPAPPQRHFFMQRCDPLPMMPTWPPN